MSKFGYCYSIYEIFYPRDRERMKGKDPFSGREKGLPAGKSMDGDEKASSGKYKNYYLRSIFRIKDF